MEKYLFASMTWQEVNEAVQQRRVVLVPVGAIEQHGPHLPIDMDNVAVITLCEETARCNPHLCVAAPPIHYGFNEHNMDFPGTISIEMQNFVNYCFDVGCSLARQGFRRIIWVNGHGSNSALCQLVARRVTNETETLSAAVDWWNLVQNTISELRESGPGGVDHACEFETSVYMHVKPELVKRELIADEYVRARGGPDWLYPDLTRGTSVFFMNNWSRMSDSGVNGAPSLATPEKGERFMNDAVRILGDVAASFRDMPVRERTSHVIKPE